MNKINGTIQPPIEENLKSKIGKKVSLNGMVYKIRRMSGFAFVLLQIPRGLIQCVYIPEKAGFELDELKEGMAIGATGEVAADQRSKAGCEIHLEEVTVYSAPTEEYPITVNQKELDASLDSLLNYRPLTLRHEKERAAFKIQEGVVTGFRQFLLQNQFTEIHTPKLVYAGAEGGANIFRLDYFGKEVFLAQSPQFYKQMMVGVYQRVFEVGPVYRAEKHDTSRHLNEYTGLDVEMGFISGFEELMQLETALLRYITEFLREEYSCETQLLQIKLPDVQEIPAVRFTEAKKILSTKLGRTNNDEDLDPEEEQLLCEYFKKEHNSRMVFITHYPSQKRPFYGMDDPTDQTTSLSFDLLFDGIEITTGGQRIHDYNKQTEKMLSLNLNPEDFAPYLMLHKYGAPPHGGFGIGLERLTMKLLGHQNVRRACLFPRDTNRVTP